MSHTTTLRTIKIQDVKALQDAVAYLQENGLKAKLIENAVPRMYYSNQYGKCAYVLKISGSPYDIGFDKQADGSYAPVFDSWGGHIQKAVGNPSSCPVPKTEEERQAAVVASLLNAYGVMAAKNELESQGYYGYEITVDKTDNSYSLEMSTY